MKDAIHAKLDEHVKGSYCARSLRSCLQSNVNSASEAAHQLVMVCFMVAGVIDVEVVMSKDAPGTGRGFCFVEFYNHSAAAHAKGVLGSETFR